MKSKRINKISICTLLFLFVFIISLFSSINAFADNTDFKIEDAIILEKSELVDGNISSFDNDTIINDVTFHKLDDYVTYKIIIKNKTNDDLMINSIVDDNNNSYIVYEYDKHENYNVKGDKSFEFLVKAIYKNELSDTTLRNQTSKVNFTLNYIKNNKEVEQRLSLNPNTKDNIHISFIALTISLIGLSTCLILNKKKNGKLFFLVVTSIFISPILVKALSLTFSITLDNNYHLYDKLLVTYNVQGNEHTVVNPYGELINNIETQTPQINGYTFEKWQLEDGSDFDSTKPITDDVKLIAKMKLDSYGISYDFGRSGEVINNNPTTYTVLDNITLNYPIKTGYTFNYWTGTILEENTKDVSFSNQTGELLFNGFFKANSYEIAFDNNTGEGVMSNLSMKYDEVKNLTLNTFTKTGYTFNGWNTKKDGSGNSYRDGEEISNLSYEDNSTVTLYAMWKPNQYTVIFNSNTGTGLMDREIFNYDETKKLSANLFEKEHYKFMGWNTEADGSGEHFDDEANVSNLKTDGEIILYAEWKERTATLNTGAVVNSVLRTISTDATKFKHYDGNNVHNFDTYDGEEIISTEDSNFPVYVWVDDDTIYWWSEAERPNFNSNSSNMFNNMNKLETINLDGLESSTAINMSQFFNGCSKLSSLDISEFNTGNVTNMSNMFSGTSALTSIDTSVLDTKNVTNMSGMFSKTGVTSIDISNFDTKNVKTMRSLFDYSKASTVIIGDINTSNVTDMYSMFGDMANITSLDLSGLDTDNVTNMASMFCAFHVTSKLTDLDISTFNTEKVQNFSLMFYGQGKLTELDLRHFNTNSATTMYMMFSGTSSLRTLDVSGWTNDKVTNMSYMFNYGGNTNINFTNFNTSNVTDMTGMFADMRSAQVLDLSGFDTANVKKMANMFGSSYSSTPMALKTVYVSDKFVVSEANSTVAMFSNARSIVGGAGTVFDGNLGTNAVIDDPDNGRAGYFTLKDARYIRFNGNGADNADPYGAMTSYYISTKTSEALKANAFTRLGYKFIGWNTKADGSGVSYTDKQLMEDVNADTIITLYAQWEKLGAVCIKQYRLQNADGTYPEEYIIESSDVVGIGEDCSFEKSVDGYQTKSDSITVTAIGATVSLDLPRNTYALTISYDSEQFSSVIGEGTYRWGEEVPIMAMMDMFGMDSYEFVNWTQIDGVDGSFEDATYSNTVFVMGKGDATIKPNAQAKTYTYTLVYDANGGEGAPPSQTKETNSRYGMVEFEISNKIPTREGYGFWGWGEASTSTKSMYNSSDQRVEPMDPGVTTIYAVWKPVSGTVQEWNGCSSMEVGTPIYLLDTRDGQAYEVNKYYMNAEHTETACWMDNLNLGSWNINEDLTSSNTNLTSTILAEDFLSWNVKEFNTTGDRDSYTVPMFVPKYSYGYRGSGSDSYGTRYGVSYNTLLASANTYDRTTGNLSSDICPKGWHIPTGGDDGELVKLVVAYGGINGKMTAETSPTHLEMTEILEHDLKFAFAGNLNYGAKEKLGAYMSSATSGTSYLISLFIEPELYNKQVTITNYAPAYYGYSIRCVKE